MGPYVRELKRAKRACGVHWVERRERRLERALERLRRRPAAPGVEQAIHRELAALSAVRRTRINAYYEAEEAQGALFGEVRT